MLSQLRGGQSIRFNRQWMLGITGIIAFMVGVSALGIAVTNERFFKYISTLVTWFIYLVVLILSPLLWLFLRFLLWLLSALQIGAIFSAMRDLFIETGEPAQSYQRLGRQI